MIIYVLCKRKKKMWDCKRKKEVWDTQKTLLMLMLNFYYHIYDNDDDIDANENCKRSPRREVLTQVIFIFIFC